jgi:hypothetical protein
MMLEGEESLNKETKKVYSGVFFNSGLHMTYNYNFGSPKLPEGVKPGTRQFVSVESVSIFNDFGVLSCKCAYMNYLDNSVVEITHQHECVTPLHITLYTKKGFKPYLAGTFLELESPTQPLLDNESLAGNWGFMGTDGVIDYGDMNEPLDNVDDVEKVQRNLIKRWG